MKRFIVSIRLIGVVNMVHFASDCIHQKKKQEQIKAAKRRHILCQHLPFRLPTHRSVPFGLTPQHIPYYQQCTPHPKSYKENFLKFIEFAAKIARVVPLATRKCLYGRARQAVSRNFRPALLASSALLTHNSRLRWFFWSPLRIPGSVQSLGS